MRVHLPALLALASAASYVACGSSDATKTVPEAAGAGGEAGDSNGAGGSKNVAGSSNSGGSLNVVGGQNGDGGAGAPATGQGGASAGEGGMLGNAAGADAAAGAGGSGDTTGDMSLPAACPGALADYTLLVGTAGDDAFTAQDVGGKKLIFGLDGMDTFPKEHGGDDCIVGGPGDDDFTNSDEFANYYFGGAGADTYHIDTTGNYVRIADLEHADGDLIGLNKVTFPFLSGAAGDIPSSGQVFAVPGYSTGTTSGVIEGSAIIYDPNSGELWLEADGGVKGSSVGDRQILTVLNKGSYTFDVDDFVLE